MLEVKEVFKAYGSHKALTNISLKIQPQSVFGLLGPNGAGKTTLIRIINQIIAPDAGQVWLNGETLQPHHIAQIGYLPEERGLYPKMKVAEQLIYLGRLKGLDKATAQQRVKKGLEQFELNAWQNKTIEELSKGMAQKVQFLATTLHQPKLLIFDEPFSGFDPVNANLIKSEILKFREAGATVIFSTHRMESVEEICDHMALIHQSEKVLEGKIQNVKEQFSEGILKFVTHKAVAETPPHFEQVRAKNTPNDCTYWLKPTSSKAQVAAAVQFYTSRANLRAFAEELPSLNEIFIKKVAPHG
jgi:ABC-2 type transport system ATP-binding protein